MSMPEPSAAAVLSWVARGQALARKGSLDEVASWMFANGAPEKARRIIKAAVGAGTTHDSDISEQGVAIGPWSDSARTTSAFYRILNDNGFTRVPIRTRVGITVTPPAGSIVGEGAAIPLSPIRLDNVQLQPVKASSLIVVTDELLRDISASGQALLSRALIGAVSAAVDAAFLDIVVDTASPAIPSSGTSATAAKADLRDALMAVNTVGTARLYWIAAVDVAKMASTLPATGGADAFVAMSPTGGELANLPCIVSSGVTAGTLMLLDASGVAADGGPVSVNASSQADILMNSAPTMSSATPTAAQMTSMFQTNSTAIKADAWFGAQKLRDDACAVITGINWGA